MTVFLLVGIHFNPDIPKLLLVDLLLFCAGLFVCFRLWGHRRGVNADAADEGAGGAQ